MSELAMSAKPKNKTQIIAKRLPTFLAPDEGKSNPTLFIQVTLDGGELQFVKTTKEVWAAVRGERYGENAQHASLGLRGLAACDYLLHLEDGVAVSVDVIPSRYHTRGGAPRCVGAAVRKGFILSPGEKHPGWEVINEELSDRDREDNDFFRLGYLGLTQRRLVSLLVALRESQFLEGEKSSTVLEDHKITKEEGGRIRVIPTSKIVKVKRQPSNAA